MRFLGLYLRARGVPAAAASVAAIPWIAWLLAQTVVGDHPDMLRSLAVLAATLAVAATASTLAGADEVLERTAAVSWPPRRAAHVAVAGAAVVAGLGAVALAGPPLAATALIVRDVSGLVGLAALTAVLLGSQLAWTLPVGWTLIVTATGPRHTPVQKVLTWLLHPAGTTFATVTALVLAMVGTAVYAVRGAAR